MEQFYKLTPKQSKKRNTSHGWTLNMKNLCEWIWLNMKSFSKELSVEEFKKSFWGQTSFLYYFDDKNIFRVKASSIELAW